MIKTERLVMSPLRLQDAYDMSGWGSHSDPRLFEYNLADLTRKDYIFWYATKRRTRHKNYYSIRDKEGRLLGYLGIKDINYRDKSAYLGVVLNPDNLSKGIGTEAIRAFLAYMMETYDLLRVFLLVNNFNRRALACYKKCGFKEVDHFEGVFENQRLDKDDKDFDKYFTCHKGVIYSKNTIMEVSREEVGNEV
ncbi:MAG: GNAT family protein [Finegoldia sp.]|nr:GNAT family protein [Finegoldia sp.]